MCVLTSSNLKKFSQEKLKASKKAGCCHTSNADTHRQQHTFTFKNFPVYMRQCVRCIAMNLIEISAILHVFVHSKFYTLFFFFIDVSVTIAASNAGHTHQYMHTHNSMCLSGALAHSHALPFTRAKFARAKLSMCECVRVSVGVCHFAISLCL